MCLNVFFRFHFLGFLGVLLNNQDYFSNKVDSQAFSFFRCILG